MAYGRLSVGSLISSSLCNPIRALNVSMPTQVADKGEKKLSKMRVVQKGNRLSITEVEKKDWEYILSLEK